MQLGLAQRWLARSIERVEPRETEVLGPIQCRLLALANSPMRFQGLPPLAIGPDGLMKAIRA